MLTNLFRPKPKPEDLGEARGIIDKYGDHALDRVKARAESCSPGSRDRAHWKRLTPVVEQLLEHRADMMERI